MTQETTFATDVEIRGLCAMLGVSVHVLLCDDMYTIKVKPYNSSNGKSQVIRLFHMPHGDVAYYDLIVDDVTQVEAIEKVYNTWRGWKVKQLVLEDSTAKSGYAECYGKT